MGRIMHSSTPLIEKLPVELPQVDGLVNTALWPLPLFPEAWHPYLELMRVEKVGLESDLG